MSLKTFAIVVCLMLICSACTAGAPICRTIRIDDFSRDRVTLKFPTAEARTAFWIAYTDCAWPRHLRTGDNAPRFESYWGPIIRGEQQFANLTQNMARGDLYFDGHARSIAITLKDFGLRLERIESEISRTKRCERIVIAE